MDLTTIVSIVLAVVGIYMLIGLIFGIYFAFTQVGKVDPVAKAGTWGFRILIIPGMTIFWPIFAKRLAAGLETPPIEQNAHRKRAGGAS